ncbi:MAG: hypothetical protein AAF907_03955 [Planctomycetota bacterium]
MADIPPIRTADVAEEPARPWWRAVLAAAGFGSAENAGGTGVSFAVHGAVLLAMALWAVDVRSNGAGVTLSLLPGAEETTELERIEVAEEEAGGSPLVISAPPMEALESEGPGIPVELLTVDAGGVGEGNGSGTSEGDGSSDGAAEETIKLPGGGTAIRKGSFTVWTIPPDPRPRQDYAIVIEVDLPEELRLRRYPKHDLYGEVKGTDSFRMRIPGNDFRDRKGFLPIRNGKAQLVIGVPGAERLVKDRIKVGSKLLKESQTLSLVF